MKSAIKYILIGCGGALLAAAMILACTAGVSVRKTLTCERLEIAILDSMQNSFVSKVDVKSYIDMATYDEYPNFEEFDYGTQNPGKYAISQAVGGFEAFKEYSKDLKDLDKNETADYLNNLDIDYGMKIILYVSRYSSKASREEYMYDIVDYLNGRRDIDEAQMRKILRELGYKVDWEGNVTWN